MKLFRYVWLLVLLAGLLFVGAAFASEATDSATSQDDGAVAIALADDCGDELGTSASINDLPDNAPDAGLLEGSSDDQACRDCHTNEELLKELAVEEEETESLSEGPG
ncbi:MAG: hypothetical protein JXA10_08320 [Anaerolineae bacterium]|nr:hypothetical protein [Anaerolineae bacterium]